jgi:hypothetical protein
VTSASKDPALAAKIAFWLNNPSNQTKAFVKGELFPSTIASYTDAKSLKPQALFGDQATMTVFGEVAKKALPFVGGPNADTYNSTFENELKTNVIQQGSNVESSFAAAAKAVTAQANAK